MPTREYHRTLITERIAQWSGVIWAVLVVSQGVIALHDALVYPEDAVNYGGLAVSVRISAWLLSAVLALTGWAAALRLWWRGDPPAHLAWLVSYNFRVLILWGITQTWLGLTVRIGAFPGHVWAAEHSSTAYFLATLPALFGVILLITRRWRRILNRALIRPETHE